MPPRPEPTEPAPTREPRSLSQWTALKLHEGITQEPPRWVLAAVSLMFLVVHCVLWSTALTGWPEPDEGGGSVYVFLAVTGVASALMFAAFRHKGRAADPDESATVDPLAGPGAAPVPGPPGLDATPLDGGYSSFASHRVRRPEPQVFVLAPSKSSYVMGLFVFALGAGLEGLVYSGAAEDSGLILLPAGLVVAGVGILILVSEQKHRFDRQEGVYRRSSLVGRAERIPLTSVRAVQLLTDLVVEQKGSDGSTERYTAHQLNLVVDDPSAPRRGVVNTGDRGETVRAARELAGFLGVPLYVGAAPAPRRAGGP